MSFGGYGSRLSPGRRLSAVQRFASLRLLDSVFKQPRHLRTRICSRPLCEVSFGRAPQNTRGMERRKAQRVEFRFRHRVRGDGISESASPHGAPLRRFWARGPYFRMGRANPDPADFAAFISIPCSRERQSHVVGPDGGPSLPDACVRNTRAGAVSCSASKRPREAPLTSETMENIFLYWKMSREQ